MQERKKEPEIEWKMKTEISTQEEENICENALIEHCLNNSKRRGGET